MSGSSFSAMARCYQMVGLTPRECGDRVPRPSESLGDRALSRSGRLLPPGEPIVAATETTFDLTIIGSGPGGYVAAIRAPQLGGTCLIWGCIPTKALLHAAEVLETSRHAGAFGVKVAPGTLDVDALQKYKDKVVLANAKGVEYLFKKNGVTLVRGR